MRLLFIPAVLLAFPPAVFAAPVPLEPTIQADWRRDGIDERMKAALTGSGWRLEDDGHALDPKTKAAATEAVLKKAMLDLRQDARRAALEAVNLMLASGRPLDLENKKTIEVLSADLPAELVASILDPRSEMNTVRAMADADLSRVAAYFDGGRTWADRRAAARPVFAGTPRLRANFPYYTAQEQSVGERLRDSAETVIGRDPFGKIVLSRLSTDGKPELPPIVIEDQSGPVVARYDFRRRAIVLDREEVLSSVVAAAPARQASALRASLSTRAALMAYLAAHPEAAAAVVKANDVVLVHELTHAWQDRRDPIFREIVRDNLPDVQPLEYEEEASLTKNLYLRSKLEHDPASVKMDWELADYALMMHGRESWRQALFKDLNDTSPSRALPVQSVQDVQALRVARTKGRTVATSDDQRAKALDLRALRRGQKELAELKSAHDARMASLNAAIDKRGPGNHAALGRYYLIQAQSAQRSTDRNVLLDQAERYARASRNAVLIAAVRRAREKTE